MRTLLSRRAVAGALGSLLLAPASQARMDAYPGERLRPLRLVVPFASGSSADQLGRLLADGLSARSGQAVFVDNRPGASGLVGTQLALRAAGDGNTLLLAHSAALLDNLVLHPRAPLDARRDLRLVTQVASAPLMLVVHPDLPSRSGPALLEHLADVVDPLAYGSQGIGSQAHLAGACVSRAANARMTHVPYRIETTMLRDLAGDHIQLAFANVPAARALVDAGRVRVLGVTGERRLATQPDVPTLRERGLDDPVLRTTGWAGIALPADAPEGLVARLDQQLRAVCRDPAFRQRVEQLGLELDPLDAEAFEARYTAERPLWASLTQSSWPSAE